MNQMNMAGFNAGNVALGHNNMQMPNNGPNGVARIPEEHVEDANYEGKLNYFIYGYLYNKRLYDAARELKNSGVPFDPSLDDSDVNGVDHNIHTDSKEGIDKDRPTDIPEFKGMNDGQGGPFLLSWFALFWDIYFAQRKNSRASNNAMQYVQHQQARLRQQEQQRMFQGQPMMPNNMADMQSMMRYQNNMQQENLRRNALQNTRSNGMQPSAQQIQQMRIAAQMSGAQGMARRDPEMDINGGRPRTPSASDHAPSPSKRQRMDGVPFGGHQMMPNGQGLQRGMPPGVMGADAAQSANHMLMNNGINPGMGDMGPDFYGPANPAMQMRGGAPPNVANGQPPGNHALQDYQMQLMLLEQQNKKRLLMARQEQDGGRPDGQVGMPGFVPGMSPGSRGGPSPGPSDRKGGTPKMNQVGLPGGGSPMPDGSLRGSPAAMNFNQMGPEMYQAQMNGNMRPPSSNPAFPAQQFNQQQMEQMARAQGTGRGMPTGWQQGPQGQGPMPGQVQPQPPAPIGTPQARNKDMPPPSGVPGATANGRPPSPAPAPPTPQTANKANPKTKKDARDRKKPTKKPSNASAPTPVSEAETTNAPTPTPSTPITPQHRETFATKTESQGQGQAGLIPGIPNGGPEQMTQQSDPTAMDFGLEGGADSYALPFNENLGNPDLFENIDFEQFLQTDGGDFNFDASAFEAGDSLEAGMTGT